MKIKKIIDLIKRRGTLIIYEGKGIQWLSDGKAVYPLMDIPEVNRSSLCAIYDITEAQQNKMLIQSNVELPSTMDFGDVINRENMVAKSHIDITIGNHTYLPYATSQGVAFIDRRYFAPFGDMDEAMLSVYERFSETGDLYFVIKNGMILVGVLLPEDIINSEFVDDMDALSVACRIAFENKQKEDSV